jgi:serine/threonine-protein kinase
VIGSRVNNYELVSLVGEGGMGSVYLARHVTIARPAAVKVMRAEYANDRTLVARFVNEARAAAAVGHPGIVDVIDVGVMPGTQLPYLMMEYLDGEDLHARLKRVGVLSVGRAVDIARQTARAVGAAHAQGLVHRDLKPANLFLVPDDQGGETVKVLDFGIAKLRPGLEQEGVKTRTGVLVGTPQYMSPEQCRNLPDGVDQRSDVYALGLILYEMVCGHPPFASASTVDLMMMHVALPPPAPRSLNLEIPPALEDVILRALAKPREDRFATMNDFARALGEALAAPPPRRSMRPLLLLAATAVAVMVGGGALRRLMVARTGQVGPPATATPASARAPSEQAPPSSSADEPAPGRPLDAAPVVAAPAHPSRRPARHGPAHDPRPPAAARPEPPPLQRAPAIKW